MDSIFAEFAILVPIVIGVVEVVKKVGLRSRYAPALALVLGVVGAIALIGGDIATSVLQGLIVGLSASGLYSGAKRTFDSE